MKWSKLKIFFSCAVILSVVLCGPAVSAKAKPDDAGNYTVSGEVLWSGKDPIVHPIATASYRGVCGKRQGIKVLRLREDRLWHKRILDMAVWLEPVWDQMSQEQSAKVRSMSVARPSDQLVIDEKTCEFNPRLEVIPVGTLILVQNSDRKDHWIVVEGKHKKREQFIQIYGDEPPVFELDTPGVHHVPVGAPIKLHAKKKDIWRISSGFHRWMDAWIVITDKTWFDSVDTSGTFTIESVPAGVYELHTWHPILGETTKIVRVPEEIDELVDISYNEIPDTFEEVRSTLITTPSEVKQGKQIFDDGGDSW